MPLVTISAAAIVTGEAISLPSARGGALVLAGVLVAAPSAATPSGKVVAQAGPALSHEWISAQPGCS